MILRLWRWLMGVVEVQCRFIKPGDVLPNGDTVISVVSSGYGWVQVSGLNDVYDMRKLDVIRVRRC